MRSRDWYDYIDAKVVVAASASVAVAVIARQVPELILMSAFTPPHEERALMEFLRQTTQVNVPVLKWCRRLLSGRLRRRLSRRASIVHYAALLQRKRCRCGTPLERTCASHWRRRWAMLVVSMARRARSIKPSAFLVLTAGRHRIFPGSGAAASAARQVVNISNSGLLIECDSALMPGNAVTFELCANGNELWHPDTDLVPARIVRSEVSKVDTDHLRYLVAAQFQRELELPSTAPIPLEATPTFAENAMADDDFDEVTLRAANRLQELARALESLESTVARICPSTAGSVAHQLPPLSW